MKKTIAILLALLLCAGFAFAQTNNMQKIYPTTSDEYKAIMYLYIAQGHSLPSTTGPWSADELAKMLEVLDYNALNDVQKATYDTVKATLYARPNTDKDQVGFNFNGSFNLETYIHTNTDGPAKTAHSNGHDITEKAFQGNHWVYSEKDQLPTLNFELETFLTDHFYTVFQGSVANSWHSDEYYTEELGVSKISTNILGLKNLKFNLAYFDGNWPYRGFLSAGGENWNIQVGRDRLNWGPGETGNLTISDNMPWQNYAKITAYSSDFKYTFLTSFYPHPMMYWDNQGTESAAWHGLDNGYGGKPAKGLSMYIGHRFELRFLKDKFTFVATEGLMYMSEDNTIDIRALNPVNFNHNNYIAASSNSTLTFEFNYTPISGVNVYGQWIVDEVAFPGIETPPSETYRSVPTAMGYLFGAKSVFTLGNGIFHINAEFAKTDPYLYLRNGLNGGDGNYGINYVVAIRNWSSVGSGITYDEYFLGYTYGPDAVVANLKAGWTTTDLRLSVEGSFFYMAHGTHDAWTKWTYIGYDPEHPSAEDLENYQYDKASPTTKHTTYNAKYTDYALRNSVEKTTVLGINATYKATSWLSLLAQADLISIKNYGNVEGVVAKDFQLVLSARFLF